MEHMKKVTRYQCQFCKKDFKTPDKHHCKFNPELKNCLTCKHLNGWQEGEEYSTEWGMYREPNIPECTAISLDMQDWNIESIKGVHYDMQCSSYEEGEYDWSKENENVK